MFDDDFFIIGEKADKPLGYPPGGIYRLNLQKLYISIMGALDVGDFETFLKEISDLTYDEAKEKMIQEFGSPEQLSKAKYRAKTKEAEGKLEQAWQQSRDEQRTLEDEYAELDEIARKRLGENLELARRNQELENEIKRLKEELTRKATVPMPIAVPKAVPPTPPLPLISPAPIAPVHGSMYDEYVKRISDVVTIADINDLASEIYDIFEAEEFNKLSRKDITELLEDLRKTGEKRAIKLAEMKVSKPQIRRTTKKEEEEEKPPAGRRERREAPSPQKPTGVAQISYQYSTPDTEVFTSMGEQFMRDYELERTIKLNCLLLFPDYWYELSPWGKREMYGWDMGMAFREAVMHLHRFSWESLVRDYGIPKEYVEAWKKVPG